MKTFKILLLLLLPFSNCYGQEELLVEDPSLYADPSLETQFAFVQELLYTAGYVPEEIRVYQTLPNHAHVYQVKLDSVQGGFVFVRWDKNKKEKVFEIIQGPFLLLSLPGAPKSYTPPR